MRGGREGVGEGDTGLPAPDAGSPLPDVGESDDTETPGDEGGGDADAGTSTDAGTETDAGTGTDDEGSPGGGSVQGVDLWPQEAVVDYTQRFGVGRPQGVAVDDAFNLWLLDGKRIGVIRSGESQPTWASNIGQAGRGFSSTVICGGAAGRAYAGSWRFRLRRWGPGRGAAHAERHRAGGAPDALLPARQGRGTHVESAGEHGHPQLQ